MAPELIPYRQVRALYDTDTITVYQAYDHRIADAALAAGTFVAPFSRVRMTWIKPSFLWMMYRCGWATKEGQQRVLSIQLSREGFHEALRRSCWSHFHSDFHGDEASWRRQLEASPVRVQWDPERGMDGAPLVHRSLQVGLSGAAMTSYVTEWIVAIDDITDMLPNILSGARPRPTENVYPLPIDVQLRIGADSPTSPDHL